MSHSPKQFTVNAGRLHIVSASHKDIIRPLAIILPLSIISPN